ncbi:hypothetical protein BT69DRAFT_1286529 [Atractiella rhizophila]|nr:hypothetical protein BT69DRAFT_1286529 [Atractiella rhizophila]
MSAARLPVPSKMGAVRDVFTELHARQKRRERSTGSGPVTPRCASLHPSQFHPNLVTSHLLRYHDATKRNIRQFQPSSPSTRGPLGSELLFSSFQTIPGK